MRRAIKTEIDRQMVIAKINRIDLSKLYIVEITQKRYNRSISQNSLYWLWLCCIEHETGNDRNDLHDLFKDMFILPIEIEVLGRKIIKHTTTDKDTAQFKQYLDKIQIFASTELSITLPEPKDRGFEEFYSYYIEKL